MPTSLSPSCRRAAWCPDAVAVGVPTGPVVAGALVGSSVPPGVDTAGAGASVGSSTAAVSSCWLSEAVAPWTSGLPSTMATTAATRSRAPRVHETGPEDGLRRWTGAPDGLVAALARLLSGRVVCRLSAESTTDAPCGRICPEPSGGAASGCADPVPAGSPAAPSRPSARGIGRTGAGGLRFARRSPQRVIVD
jgi:hypothetical protein